MGRGRGGENTNPPSPSSLLQPPSTRAKFIIQRSPMKNACTAGYRKLVIPAHKFVLSISSPVFENIFTVSWRRKKFWCTKRVSLHHRNLIALVLKYYLTKKIVLKKNVTYSLVASISGPPASVGVNGESSDQCSGVTFTFLNSKQLNSETTVDRGQFLELLFSHKKY